MESIFTFPDFTKPSTAQQQILHAALIGMHLVDRALVAPTGGPIAELDRTLELVRAAEEDGLVDEAEEIAQEEADENRPTCRACFDDLTDKNLNHFDARYCNACGPRRHLVDD